MLTKQQLLDTACFLYAVEETAWFMHGFRDNRIEFFLNTFDENYREQFNPLYMKASGNAMHWLLATKLYLF